MAHELPSFELKATFNVDRALSVVKFHKNRRLILSGGDDASLNVYTFEQGNPQQLTSVKNLGFGGVSSGAWIDFIGDREDTYPAFAYGTAGGKIYVYGWDATQSKYCLIEDKDAAVMEKQPILNLAYDPVHSHLAFSCAGGVRLCIVTSKGCIEDTPHIIPGAVNADVSGVFFMDRGSMLLICYRENHKVQAYRINPWGSVWTKLLSTRIGEAALGLDNHLAVTNLVSGVDIYTTPPRVPAHHFPHPVLHNRPVQVSFLSRSTVIIGSEFGHITVWNWQTNGSRQLTHNANGDRVQLVDAQTYGNDMFVASGGSVDGRNTIKIWSSAHNTIVNERRAHRRVNHRGANGTNGFSVSQMMVVIVVCLFAQTVLSHAPDILNYLYRAVESFRSSSRASDVDDVIYL